MVKTLLGVLLLIGMAHVASPCEDTPSVEEKLTNTLKWSTASEVENFGYDVYRGRSEEGPFERITTEPVLGAGTTDLPSFYEFVDGTIEPGVAYFYYVESLSMSGTRKRFTPVIRAKPKGKARRTAEPHPETETSAPKGPAPEDPLTPALRGS